MVDSGIVGELLYKQACCLAFEGKCEEAVKRLREAVAEGSQQASWVLGVAPPDADNRRLFVELCITMFQTNTWRRYNVSSDSNDSSRTNRLYDRQYHVDVTAKDLDEQFCCSDAPHTKDDDWLVAGQPAGTVVPPASGREAMRTPNLNSANPSFAARLIMLVRDRFGNDAPSVYRAAHISRKTYSAIVSNELRPVSKLTAIAFALALNLSLDEAIVLLRSAGYALSEFMLEDMIIRACFVAGIHDVDKVNEILAAHEVKPLPSCQEP